MIYLPTSSWLVYGKLVCKYTSPIDPVGIDNIDLSPRLWTWMIMAAPENDREDGTEDSRITPKEMVSPQIAISRCLSANLKNVAVLLLAFSNCWLYTWDYSIFGRICLELGPFKRHIKYFINYKCNCLHVFVRGHAVVFGNHAPDFAFWITIEIVCEGGKRPYSQFLEGSNAINVHA